MSLKFLQISDVHFGQPMTGGKLRLPESVAARREEERRDCFARAMSTVLERDLDGVLIPGDLFDDESMSIDLLRFVMHELGRIKPRPVFIAPGNHDAFGGPSPYNPHSRRATAGLEWPDNVVIFAHEDFRTVGWPGKPNVSVTGCGVVSNVCSDTRRLRDRIARDETTPQILLFHGSRDDSGWLQAHKSTYPFTRDELVGQGFDWTALGHYHRRQVIHDDDGRPLAGYGGCLIATGLDELNEHGALIVNVESGKTSVEPVELDERRVVRVECDLTGSDFFEDARSRVDTALQAAGVADTDLVLLEFTGRRATGLDLSFLNAIAEPYFYFKADLSRLEPDVDLDAYPTLERATTTEQRFVARLRDSLEDPATADVARRALLYGLDVLHRARLDTRYEA